MDKLPLKPRMPISLLGSEVIERIAAGEVIERPASALRELVENALDADARAIRVELREGGIRLLRVSDDGVGIRAEELEMAVAPHATNKLRRLADLDHIETLGFRGEALASLTAVAEVHICSTADDSGIGHTLLARPGHTLTSGLEGRACGTTVTVRDLFHLMPARHAMLRSPRHERNLALGVMRAYALAYPHVRFTVFVDGDLLLQTTGKAALTAVHAIYGADLAFSLIPLGPVAVAGGTLSGWVSPRGITEADRQHIVMCINGRPVFHRVLQPALEAGYRPLLRKGRHPILLATITLDAEQIDVNVHPAKAEVRVREERALAAVLRETVYTALGQAPVVVTPPLTYDGHFFRTHQFALPTIRHRRDQRIGEPRPRYKASGSAHRSTGPLPPMVPLGQLENALIVAQTADGTLCLIDQHRAHERLLYNALVRDFPPNATPVALAAAQLNPEASDILDRANDSHARADEPRHTTIQGQLLLEPLMIELSPRQAELLSSRLRELGELGLICEPFGGATFLIRALPTMPGAATGLTSAARAVAADAAEDADDWLDHFRIALACRAAIRRGQALATSEQRALLDDLILATAPAVCPHGSPIMLEYSQSFLARTFEWGG